MKRVLFVLLATVLWISVAAGADDVQAVQTKLKEGGFYFGEVDGALSSDLSAALTRYQIRNGLQITGNLNAETSKALGVKAEVTAARPAAAPSSETWRQLRKTDQQFLSRPTAAKEPGRAKPVAPAKANAPAKQPPAILEPATADGSKMVLSPDRLSDYIAAFVLAGLDPQVGAELEFFADRVHYYNEGVVGRDKIRADLRRYDAHWPQRSFWLAGNVTAARQPDSRIRVTFPLRYQLRSGSKHATGKIRKSLLLEVRGEDLQIVGVDETKA